MSGVRLLLLVVLVAVAGCGGGRPDPPPDSGWTTFHDREHGFSVRFPSTWHRATRPLTPHLTDPAEILALGTGRLPVNGADRCAQVPVAALRAASASDVVVAVFERRGDDRGFAPRDRPFLLGAADESETGPCSGLRRPPWHSYWRSFTDSGRPFYLLAAVGRRATAERRAQLQRVVDSLRFAPRQGSE
jgi:hypothetical protein